MNNEFSRLSKMYKGKVINKFFLLRKTFLHHIAPKIIVYLIIILKKNKQVKNRINAIRKREIE